MEIRKASSPHYDEFAYRKTAQGVEVYTGDKVPLIPNTK